jgi:hypothetical protein
MNPVERVKKMLSMELVKERDVAGILIYSAVERNKKIKEARVKSNEAKTPAVA